MFIEIRISNVAVLKDLRISLEPGLNVLSGETGAGKSIVVDALEVLLGGRASSGMVRAGEARALVEGVVDVGDLDAVAELLAELGLESDESYLVLRREVRAEGRSRGWVNGSPATAGMLRRIGSLLVDIHGQHEHQRLLSAGFQRQVLDAFGGCADLAEEVADGFRRVAELGGRLASLEERRGELESRADFIRFQLDEIAGAKLHEGEDEELRIEANRLAHADTLARESHALHRLLHAEDAAVADRLADAAARLRRLGEMDPALEACSSTLDDAYHQVSDAAGALADYATGIDHDPARLESIRERQALIQRLERKYGPTLPAVIERGETLRRELDELETADMDAGALRTELERAGAAWQAGAEELSRHRREAAARFSAEARAVFPGLGLQGARLAVHFEDQAGPSAGGLERVRFMATMNPGFPPAPLSQIASGGEMSRVMLALNSVLAGIDDLPTLVFDEVDAGVGGGVAARVADRLAAVASGRQVLVVTHLARIAARASNHLVVEKDAVDGAVVSVVRQLDGDERVHEIARMLGGDPGSDPSLEHARELLGRGR